MTTTKLLIGIRSTSSSSSRRSAIAARVMNWNLIMRNENNDDADDADMIALAFSSLQFRFVLACAWLNKVEQQDDT